MMLFIRTTWRMIFFWKLLLGGTVLIFAFAVMHLELDDFGVVFNDAVKAPFCALASVGALVISMIPKNPGPNDTFADLFVRSVGAYTTCLAGWYWLAAETGGDPSQYLRIVIPVFAFIALIFVVMPFLSYVTLFFLTGVTIARCQRMNSQSGRS